MPRKCQDLSEKQKQDRIIFAYSILKSGIDLKKIIFSDESRFAFHDDSGLLWRRILYSYVAQIGLKWVLISKGLTGRSPSSCRSRFQKIISKGKVSELEASLNLSDMTHF